MKFLYYRQWSCDFLSSAIWGCWGKCQDNYWLNCNEIWYRYSCPTQDELQWDDSCLWWNWQETRHTPEKCEAKLGPLGSGKVAVGVKLPTAPELSHQSDRTMTIFDPNQNKSELGDTGKSLGHNMKEESCHTVQKKRNQPNTHSSQIHHPTETRTVK